MRFALIWLAVAGSLSAGVQAEPPKIMNDRVVDEHGMTLYVFDKDSPGKSACMDACASKWPAAMVDSYDKASVPWSTLTRDAGQKQWAYKGRPLYRWSMDKKPGDTLGDGMYGVWHAARP